MDIRIICRDCLRSCLSITSNELGESDSCNKERTYAQSQTLSYETTDTSSRHKARQDERVQAHFMDGLVHDGCVYLNLIESQYHFL